MKTNRIDKFLSVIERVGNKLPHPATLFLYLTLFVIVISCIGSALNWEVSYTGLVKDASGVLTPTQINVTVNNLLSQQGIKHIFTSMISNFTSFAPLGTVLVALVGISVAERSGLIAAVLRKVAIATPKQYITMMVIFLGIMANIASDAGYIILPPLAALIFLSFKRNPIVGLVAAFAGVSGGFAANLLLSSLDPLMAGFTQEAARILDPNYIVNPASNWFFLAASTVLIVIVGTYVTDKIVEPRLGEYKGDVHESFDSLTDKENRALKNAGLSLIAVILVCIALYFILTPDVFLSSAIVPIIVIISIFPGIVYGKSMKEIKNDSDVMNMIGQSFSAMGGYLVLVFFAGQFIGLFTYSNIGTIAAVNGANILKSVNLPPIVLVFTFVLIVAFINLFMGSASAKWAILAPIFVPILMELGLTPELTQLAYRIGDSSTNIISPLMSYFPMILVYMKIYDNKASIGTLISTMLPYSVAFLVSWMLLLGVWMLLNLPLGIGGFIYF